MICRFATSRESTLVLESLRDAILSTDDGRRLLDVPAEDLGFDEPGQPDGELVADKLLGWNLEDLVDFLESELFCFADEAEDHEPGDEVEAGVEADWLEC